MSAPSPSRPGLPPLGEALRLFARRTLDHLPASLLPRLRRADCIALAYHAVAPPGRHPVPESLAYDTKDATRFEADLRWLERFTRPITLPQLERLRLQGSPPPPPTPPATSARRTSLPPVLITFDDGYRESIAPAILAAQRGFAVVWFQVAGWLVPAELLPEHRAARCLAALARMPHEQQSQLLADLTARPDWPAPAHARLRWEHRQQLSHRCGQRIDPQLACQILALQRPIAPNNALAQLESRLVASGHLQPAPWPFADRHDLAALTAAGVCLGAHGLTHRLLEQLPPEAADAEIADSVHAIAALTSQPTIPFAFPYHARGLDRARLERIRSRIPRLGLYFDMGHLRCDHPAIVQRIGADNPHPPPPPPASNLPTLIARAARRPGYR